ncbi:Dihydrolipoyllysine-residue acetyltransferase component of pyruvate dehydrogenase complex [Kordia antarctica]|uniref:Acetyltransferase component of pyruvate dehydrogenase complex n=1 Tax=Kordia antarctica TaxID=1218801 RepID=A0A7L4ZL63_9FLAO|nr:pyruvate dehydrogenase complex dihydrolipoamide acetyltransferase [Kordia antarctica]QHI36674.1 Dihydrolipoyllysine-residue acetyltransferase component of pyruvate dehydrogenase complex [Kordia antarctica]
MAEIINMPRLSDTMEEGVVASWLKKVGDKIVEGDILAEIETDKATMEFESFHEGTLLYIGVQEGETAPVDTLLAIIGDEGEDVDALVKGASGEKKETKEETSENKSEEKTKTSETKTEEAPKAEASKSVEMPAGAIVVTMPRLSDTMEEGTVASWLKEVGDTIEEGDILAEIETDKATMEFESFQEGTLLYIGVQEGETAPVDSILAIIGEKGTDVDTVLKAAKSSGKSNSAKAETTTSEDKKNDSKPAEEKQIEEKTETSKASGNASSDGRIIASPLAKKIAEDKGINLSEVEGTGDHGRIIKRDIENFTPAAKVAPKATSAPAAAKETAVVAPFVPAGEESSEEVKNSQMRKTIARRLGESKFTAPHYYLTVELDMDNAIASRKTINAIPDIKVSFNDMIVKACAMALRKHPQVNTSWNDATTTYNKHIHVGVAVAVDEGLLVPVLKFADQMSLTTIGSQVRDLAGKARSKKISPAEMDGSTFTISNLGMFGILEFTSIINQPNSAILSIGTIVEKPVVKNGEIVVGNTMKVTLACDHRTVDGATGAQFLQTVKQYIENPVTMLA